MTTRHRYTPLLAAAAALFTLACGLDDGAAKPARTGDAGPDAGTEPLAFEPCPLRVTMPFTAPPTGPVPSAGFDGRYSPLGEWLAVSDGLPEMTAAMAECATAKMPAVWSDPEGDSIDVFVKRYPAAEQPAKGQLWMLEGGPGWPSSTLEHIAYFIGAANPTLDIYLPDHRGTGKSTFAGCDFSLPPSECAASVPHLDGLTTTGAARDLAALIDASRTGSQQVFVYGVSYGSYWAQRYLQVRPEQPAAVILDSVVPVDMDFAEFDRNFDDKARAVLALCQADATCSGKLGPDPVAKAEQAIATGTTGTCSLPLVDRGYLGALVGGDYFDRLLLPASIYRVLRCNDADVAWLEKVKAYRGWFDGLFVGFSLVLNKNIVLSELWDSNATGAEIRAEWETMLAAEGMAASHADLATVWPKYPLDAYDGQWPASPAPILALQGGMDARTPYGDVVRAHYSGENRHYFDMPNATHGLVSPLAAPMADLAAPGCGWQVIQSFLADPTNPPDTSCVAGMMPVDFGNPPAEWLRLVGIDDLWENP